MKLALLCALLAVSAPEKLKLVSLFDGNAWQQTAESINN